MFQQDTEERARQRVRPHNYEAPTASRDQGTCMKCGLAKGNSIHGDMDKIAEKIAEREDNGDRPKPYDTRAGEGARATNIRPKE